MSQGRAGGWVQVGLAALRSGVTGRLWWIGRRYRRAMVVYAGLGGRRAGWCWQAASGGRPSLRVLGCVDACDVAACGVDACDVFAWCPLYTV